MERHSNLSQFEKDDASFEHDLKESMNCVWKAASLLSSKGYEVIIRPTFVRPSIDLMNEYSDDGDLAIVQRIEIKRRKIEFSCEADYPYKTVIIDVAHTWDKAKQKPFGYMIFNSSMTSYCIVLGSTYSKWRKVKKKDRFKKRDRTFYELEKEYCYFFKV